MSAVDELTQLLSGGARVVVLAQRDVDLQSIAAENNLFLLRLAEGSLAAGGRGGGFGERRVVNVSLYRYSEGACEKLFETEDAAKVAEFEVPYHVARMPMTLRDGTEIMGYGVVDPELVGQFAAKASQLK